MESSDCTPGPSCRFQSFESVPPIHRDIVRPIRRPKNFVPSTTNIENILAANYNGFFSQIYTDLLQEFKANSAWQNECSFEVDITSGSEGSCAREDQSSIVGDKKDSVQFPAIQVSTSPRTGTDELASPETIDSPAILCSQTREVTSNDLNFHLRKKMRRVCLVRAEDGKKGSES